MATSVEFVEYICDQIRDAGKITYKKMFGEYAIWCNGKFVACFSEDKFLVKITAAGTALYPDHEEVPPYEGARPYMWVEDVDDQELLTRLIRETYEELPEQKPKKPKASRKKKD